MYLVKRWKPKKKTTENRKRKHGGQEKMTDKRDDRDKRDGMKGDRKAWPEKVALALQPFGTEKQGLWFTHAAIVKRLQERGYSDPPVYLSVILRAMVKDGYLERADKPNNLKPKYRARPEYIYRRTGKAFVAKEFSRGMTGNPGKTMKRGYQIFLDHPRLPKWFRDMMI